MEDARQTWDAAADRSSWAISLGNARTSARCAAAEEGAADMAAGVRDIADDSEPAPLPAGVPTWEEEISDEQVQMRLEAPCKAAAMHGDSVVHLAAGAASGHPDRCCFSAGIQKLALIL